MKNPEIVVMSPTVFTKYTNQKEVIRQQYRLCLAMADYQLFGVMFFANFGTSIRKDLVVEESTIPSEKVSLSMYRPAWQKNPSGFFKILAICYDH